MSYEYQAQFWMEDHPREPSWVGCTGRVRATDVTAGLDLAEWAKATPGPLPKSRIAKRLVASWETERGFDHDRQEKKA